MNPILMGAASRLAPVLSRVLMRGGSFASPFWKTQQIDVPDVRTSPVGPQAGSALPAAPISQSNYGTPANYSAGMSPNARVAHGFGMLPPSASNGVPTMRENGLTDIDKAMVPIQHLARSSSAPSPLDNAKWPYGPIGAPQDANASLQAQSPEMSFFQRNAAMMMDPVTGQFIDPSAARQAQVRGPDLINKMMAYLHNKDIG